MFDGTQEEIQLVEQVLAPEAQEQPQQEQKMVEKQPSSTPQDSFKSIREKAERAERERDELKKMLESYQSQNKSPQESQEDLEVNIGEDDLVEGKHVKKFDKKYDKRFQELEKQLQDYRRRDEEAAENARVASYVKAQYPDIDQIVSENNLNILKEQHPEILDALKASKDKYSVAVAAYKFIKNMGIGNPEPYKEEKARVEANLNKPRSSSSVSPQQGESPLIHANQFASGLTPQLKAQLQKEMADAIKRA